MAKVYENKILNSIEGFLTSYYFIPIVLCFGFVCYTFKLTEIVVSVYAFLFILILLFCRDVKNIFVPLFFVAFFIPDLEVMTDYLVYYIAVGSVILTLIGFFIYKTIKDGVKILKGGKFTMGLFFSFSAFLLAGIIGQFNLINSLTILTFCVAIYILYVIAINYTKNLKEFFEKLLLIGGIVVGIQIAINFLSGEENAFFCAVCINTIALYVTMGVIACFTLALKGEKDYLYFILAIVLSITVAMSFCRMAMILTAITDVVFSIILYKKSKNKKHLIIIALITFAIVGLTLFISPIRDFWVRVFTGKTGLSNRENIWAFCFDRFLEHPIFGYGFYYLEEFGVAGSKGETGLILAHNTLIQWITCTGIIGSLLLVPFYINKYKILCKNINLERLFIFTSIIMVEISGIMDQSATSDPFLPILVILMIGSLEKTTQKEKS